MDIPSKFRILALVVGPSVGSTSLKTVDETLVTLYRHRVGHAASYPLIDRSRGRGLSPLIMACRHTDCKVDVSGGERPRGLSKV